MYPRLFRTAAVDAAAGKDVLQSILLVIKQLAAADEPHMQQARRQLQTDDTRPQHGVPASPVPQGTGGDGCHPLRLLHRQMVLFPEPPLCLDVLSVGNGQVMLLLMVPHVPGACRPGACGGAPGTSFCKQQSRQQCHRSSNKVSVVLTMQSTIICCNTCTCVARLGVSCGLRDLVDLICTVITAHRLLLRLSKAL